MLRAQIDTLAGTWLIIHTINIDSSCASTNDVGSERNYCRVIQLTCQAMVQVEFNDS
jgi:hypothetical protein